MENKTDTKRLSVLTLAGYGAGDLGGNLFFTMIAFWLLNYLTDVVGLAASLAGYALLIGKIWDAVTDPAVGFLSDRTRSRWGRRRPWFLFASIPLGLSAAFLFRSPQLSSQGQLFAWASLAYMLICTMYTMVNIPYSALTPELTQDFNERTKLNGYRMMFAVVGTLIGAGAALPIVSAFPDKTTGFLVMGCIFGGIMTLSALIPFFAVREPGNPAPVDEVKDLLRTYAKAMTNKPFLLILIPWALNTIGVTVVTSCLIYYFKYVLGNEGGMTPALIVLLVTAMICIPLCVLVSNKLGKKRTYITGLAIFSGATMGIFFFGHLVSYPLLLVTMAVAGLGFSTHYVMPWSIVPDTIDYDYASSGKRREGVYYGLWTFIAKSGQALAGLFVALTLSASGYVANIEQSASALFAIRFLVGPFTALFFFISCLVLTRYPIDEKAYAQIRQDVAMRDEEMKSQAE